MLKTENTTLERDPERGDLCLGVVDGCKADQKLELVLCEQQSGSPCLELRLVAWDEGLGWYRQQTLALPAELTMLDVLIHRARRLMSRRTQRDQSRGAVLNFPLAPAGCGPIKPSP